MDGRTKVLIQRSYYFAETPLAKDAQKLTEVFRGVCEGLLYGTHRSAKTRGQSTWWQPGISDFERTHYVFQGVRFHVRYRVATVGGCGEEARRAINRVLASIDSSFRRVVQIGSGDITICIDGREHWIE